MRPLRLIQRITLALALALGMASILLADSPPPDLVSQSQSGQRTVEEIMKDFQASAKELKKSLSPRELGDEAKRTEAAPTVLPVLKKMQGYLGELRQLNDPQATALSEQISPQLQTFLAVFGDAPTLDNLEKQSKATDEQAALSAKGSLLMVHWLQSSQDAAAQTKLLDEAKKLLDANPGNEKIISAVASMSQLGPATPELATQAKRLAVAQQGKIEEDKKQRLASMENKPLVIEGVRPDGGKFSTASWKGKVIFVDFWATWCGPCRAELPRVKKAYADFHDKGLEVLGVSCDEDAKDLDTFLNENKDMPWPQLFDAKHPGWSPIATSYGIDSIPTMFLIDRKGTLRSVTARENFEELIPKLLAEKGE